MPERRKVYVIDDDSDLRNSLGFLLETMGIGVIAYECGIQFLQELEQLAPAPIVLDLRMPEMDGTQILAELGKRENAWPVIMLTGHGEVGVAVQAIKAGAIDFLEKPVNDSILLAAIEDAFEKLAAHTTLKTSQESAAARLALLTKREREVLDNLCEGRSNREVAEIMKLSPRTVEMHRANALRQLKVKSLIEVASLKAAAQA